MNDTGIFPKFYIEPVQNKAASEAAGRPIFRDTEFVEIRIAGDKFTVVVRKVSDEDKARRPQAYEAFQNNQKQALEGTPIEQWPIMTPAKVSELKALNILTVESLAELPDGRLGRLGMEGRELQNKAKAFLSSATDHQIEHKQAAVIGRLEQKIDLLESQIKALGEKPRQRRSREKAA